MYTCSAPIAQGIEHRPPEPGAQVQVLLGAPYLSECSHISRPYPFFLSACSKEFMEIYDSKGYLEQVANMSASSRKWPRGPRDMKKKVRVMAIDNNIDICEMLEAVIRSDPDLEWVGYAEDGVLALETISKLNPDVILLDIIMPRLNGVHFLEQLITMYPKEKPKIITLSAIAQQDIIRTLSKLGVDYYLLKPIDATTLINRIKQAAGLNSAEAYKDQVSALQESGKGIETHVARLLFELRMPTYFKGYSYLKDAICMVVENSDIYAPITVDLYTKIAERQETTPPVVEAAIRYAIRKTWKRGDPVQLKKLFGAFSDLNEERAPTNSLFITRAAEEIKVNLSH
mgnify:FL=1